MCDPLHICEYSLWKGRLHGIHHWQWLECRVPSALSTTVSLVRYPMAPAVPLPLATEVSTVQPLAAIRRMPVEVEMEAWAHRTLVPVPVQAPMVRWPALSVSKPGISRESVPRKPLALLVVHLLLPVDSGVQFL